ncbi:2-succinyl-6-hydroxy-2, 4-cyclohexadiene-1-carboxylate synthase [Microbulbifer sp. NBRC 101763]|uniref:alpha/beta fold hydrolase n=1 Tax=Microbulbifer sp. NBRC 101763 TaxID=1113820 RepID=UPI0030A98B59
MTNNSETNNNTQKMDQSQKKPKDTLILLHGALADERMWEPHIQLLSKEFTAVNFTQRHFGINGQDSNGNFGIDTHAEDLNSFIKEKTSKPVHLAAWSYGADVALNAAIKSPTLFKSLFLYEPGYPGHLDNEEMAKYMQDAEAMFGKVFQAVSDGNLAVAVESLIDGSGNKVGYFSSQSQNHRSQQLENTHTLPLQLNQSEQPSLDKTHLSRIQIPTTIAFGSDTRSLFRIVSKSAAIHISSAKLIEVLSENHMLPLENPEQFSQLIKEHIAREE